MLLKKYKPVGCIHKMKQVTKATYEEQARAIDASMAGIHALAKTQIGLMRTVGDTELRRELVGNGREMFRELRELATVVARHARSTVRREVSPNMKSGFAKPLPVSGALAAFAGWAPGELRSRNDATRAICEYIRREGLAVAADRRRIVPDERLGALLGTRAVVTYNDIQGMLRARCFADAG